MIVINTPKDQDPDAWKKDREDFFSIDGEVHTIPAKVPPFVALEATEMVATMGEVAGTRELMVLMLGRKSWDALRQCRGLTVEDRDAIQKVVREKVFGGLEEEGKG